MIKHFPVVVISGARQVGKSTLLENVLPDWERVVLDPAMDVGNARADPDLFLDNNPSPLVLDEIQYAPELVAAIKRRVDISKKPSQYILTGSQQWSVIQPASESLAGRAVFIDLESFCMAEICQKENSSAPWLARYLDNPEDFVAEEVQLLDTPKTLFEHLWRGFLPGVDPLEDEFVGDYYRAYLRTYIERDVRLLGDVSDWQQFGRFVALASAMTAQEINFSQFGRQIGVTPQTAQRWLAALKATFQWYELPAYHGNTIKRISAKPKGFFADTGLTCSLQMISSAKALGGHPLAGALFETAIAAEIRKIANTLTAPPHIHHWRTHGGAEVDILLERDGRLYPVEIKLGTRPTRGDTRGISALRETYPKLNIAPGLVICPIHKIQRLSDCDYAIPWNLW